MNLLKVTHWLRQVLSSLKLAQRHQSRRVALRLLPSYIYPKECMLFNRLFSVNDLIAKSEAKQGIPGLIRLPTSMDMARDNVRWSHQRLTSATVHYSVLLGSRHPTNSPLSKGVGEAARFIVLRRMRTSSRLHSL